MISLTQKVGLVYFNLSNSQADRIKQQASCQ